MIARRHFLAAIDFSAGSRAVLARAVELARAHGALLTVLHVIEEIAGSVAAAIDARDLRGGVDLARQDAARQLEAAVIAAKPGRTNWTARVEVGSPPAAILSVAAALNVDLIVLGAHGRRSLRQKIFGSTADRVARGAATPVLVVRRPVEMTYRKVIVALDLSPSTGFIATTAADLCPNTELRLVHVLHLPMAFEQALLRSGAGQEKMAAYRWSLFNQAEEKLRGLATEGAGGMRPARYRVVDGEPADRLLRLSRVPDVDLVVLGPRGHGTVLRAVLGSVSLRLLREAACDVLIVPPPAGPAS